MRTIVVYPTTRFLVYGLDSSSAPFESLHCINVDASHPLYSVDEGSNYAISGLEERGLNSVMSKFSSKGEDTQLRRRNPKNVVKSEDDAVKDGLVTETTPSSFSMLLQHQAHHFFCTEYSSETVEAETASVCWPFQELLRGNTSQEVFDLLGTLWKKLLKRDVSQAGEIGFTNSRCLFIVPDDVQPTVYHRLLRVILGHLQFESCLFVSESSTVLHKFGVPHGIVVNLDFEKFKVTALEDGSPMQYHTFHMNYGLDDLMNMFLKFLLWNPEGFVHSLPYISLKHPKDYLQSLFHFMRLMTFNTNDLGRLDRIVFNRNDKAYHFNVDLARFVIPNVIFNPTMFGYRFETDHYLRFFEWPRPKQDERGQKMLRKKLHTSDIPHMYSDFDLIGSGHRSLTHLAENEPLVMDETLPLDLTVYELLRRTGRVGLRKRLTSHVFIIGAGAHIDTLSTELKNRVNELHSSLAVSPISPITHTGLQQVWLGGKVMSTYDALKERFTTRADYENYGFGHCSHNWPVDCSGCGDS
ncbi:hypothetical protein PCE1_002404 [Barthelona sp. PCE]